MDEKIDYHRKLNRFLSRLHERVVIKEKDYEELVRVVQLFERRLEEGLEKQHAITESYLKAHSDDQKKIVEMLDEKRPLKFIEHLDQKIAGLQEGLKQKQEELEQKDKKVAEFIELFNQRLLGLQKTEGDVIIRFKKLSDRLLEIHNDTSQQLDKAVAGVKSIFDERVDKISDNLIGLFNIIYWRMAEEDVGQLKKAYKKRRSIWARLIPRRKKK